MRFIGKFHIIGQMVPGELSLRYASNHGRPSYEILADQTKLGVVPDDFLDKIRYDEPSRIDLVGEYDSPEGHILEFSYSIMKDYVPLYKNKWFYIVVLGVPLLVLSFIEFGQRNGWW